MLPGSILKYTSSKLFLKTLENSVWYRGLSTKDVYLLHKKVLNIKTLPCITTYRMKSTEKSTEEVDLDQPIKFSTSNAAKWDSKYLYYSPREQYPWYQPLVIVTSIAMMLIYFTILREENDLDLEIGKSLYDRLEGIEEEQLKNSIARLASEGKDASAIQKRLAEIEAYRGKLEVKKN